MVGRDGVIYVATGFPEPPTLHAVDPSGAIRWSTVLGDDELAAPPVQTSDGSIYTSLWTYRLSRRSHFVKLRASGELAWRIELPESASTPSVSDDDRIFVPASDPESAYAAPHAVYEIGSDAAVRLAVPPTKVISAPIALDHEGRLYLALAGGVRVATCREPSATRAPTAPAPRSTVPEPSLPASSGRSLAGLHWHETGWLGSPVSSPRVSSR